MPLQHPPHRAIRLELRSARPEGPAVEGALRFFESISPEDLLRSHINPHARQFVKAKGITDQAVPLITCLSCPLADSVRTPKQIKRSYGSLLRHLRRYQPPRRRTLTSATIRQLPFYEELHKT